MIQYKVIVCCALCECVIFIKHVCVKDSGTVRDKCKQYFKELGRTYYE